MFLLVNNWKESFFVLNLKARRIKTETRRSDTRARRTAWEAGGYATKPAGLTKEGDCVARKWDRCESERNDAVIWKE